MINGRHNIFSFLRNSQIRDLISWFIEVCVALDWKPPFEIYDMQEKTGTKVKRDKRRPAINWAVVVTKKKILFCWKLIQIMFQHCCHARVWDVRFFLKGSPRKSRHNKKVSTSTRVAKDCLNTLFPLNKTNVQLNNCIKIWDKSDNNF